MPERPTQPRDKAHETALAVLRAYVTTYCHDRLGRQAPDRSRLLALDALDTLDER